MAKKGVMAEVCVTAGYNGFQKRNVSCQGSPCNRWDADHIGTSHTRSTEMCSYSSQAWHVRCRPCYRLEPLATPSALTQEEDEPESAHGVRARNHRP